MHPWLQILVFVVPSTLPRPSASPLAPRPRFDSSGHQLAARAQAGRWRGCPTVAATGNQPDTIEGVAQLSGRILVSAAALCIVTVQAMVPGFALGSSVASRFPRTRESRPRQTTRPLLPSEGKEVHASRQHSRTQEWQSRPSTRSSRRATYNGNAFGRMWHEFGHFSCFFTDSSTQESPLADILSFQMWVWLSLVQGTRIKMPEA